MKPVYVALYMEAGKTWVIGRYEESQDAFDAMVNDLKEYINYNVDGNYVNQKLTDDMFIPDMKLVVKSDDYRNLYVHVDKNGMGARVYTDPVPLIACEWRIERHDKAVTHQGVLDSKKKEEQE